MGRASLAVAGRPLPQHPVLALSSVLFTVTRQELTLSGVPVSRARWAMRSGAVKGWGARKGNRCSG